MTKILVIDDETTLREEIVEWLTLEDYETMSASDGADGIDLALQYQPDLIICDISMPKMDGYQVILELQSNLLYANTPFIFITAKTSIEDVRYGMTLGADDYITKPFTRLQLLQSIDARLQRKARMEYSLNQQIEHLSSALNDEHKQRILKSRLIGMFAHDFRNPLAVIMSSTGLLKDYSDKLSKEKQLNKLQRIEVSVHRLLHMLDEMLLIAEMEGGHLKFSPSSTDLTSLISTTIENFQIMYADSRRILFKNALNGSAFVDARLFSQIVDNLLSNATKYSPNDSDIIVRIDEKDDNLFLIVKDQGIGISETDQANIFDAYERGSNVNVIQGTGLGLAIVKQAVDLHGGTINLDSQLGKGTTFTINIPISKRNSIES